MTNKRFTCDNDYYKGLILKDNLTNEILEEDGIGGYYTACTKLNELYEENQKLKSKVDDITVAVEVETCKVIENVINLIDKKIESHKDDISSYGSMYGAYLEDRLNELKKELK